AAYYLDLVLAADARLRTREQLEWLARLDEESDDLNAAVRWATESGRLETALRLLAHSACYWWMRGNRVTSAALAAALLARLGPTRFAGLEEEYVMCVLVTAWAGNIDDGVRARLEEVRGLLPLTYLPQRVDFLMMLLSMLTGPPDDFAGAYAEIMSNTARLPPWQEALARAGAAFVLQALGRVDEAVEHFERGLAAFRAIGERWGTVLVLSGLGQLYQEQGDHRRAHALADEALSMARELGATTEIAEALCRRGDTLQDLGDPVSARDDYALAADLSRRNGSMETLAWAHLGLGEVALSRGENDVAGALLARARDECPGDWYSTEDTRRRIHTALTKQTKQTGPTEQTGPTGPTGPTELAHAARLAEGGPTVSER
ncbi:MAG TPA: tetratricopeptide repeat protein, partial [Nonomuraea sp.]|nr:tetratricopeptide repeat protein [Nonomuraea sp.]